MARKGLKQYLEVSSCAIRSTILPLRTRKFGKRKRCPDAETPHMFKSNAPDLCSISTNIPVPSVRWPRTRWGCTSKRSANGGNGGLRKDLSLRIVRVRGAQGVFPPEDEAQVIALACEFPSRFNLPLSHFTLTELLAFVKERLDIPSISQSTIWRWLHHHALRPWKTRMWLFPRDPDFLAKATLVLDLYQGMWQGQPLGPDDFVICADEKPGIQVLQRCHPGTPPQPGRDARVEHEYIRHGTIAYLAALDVHAGTVTGRVDDKTGIDPFGRLVHTVMRKRPYRTARRVFWIVDNGASHHPNTFPQRLKDMYPNAIAVHLPKHASWLNQIELFFSILQRKLLSRLDAHGRTWLSQTIIDFERHYNRTAQPFNWRFTAADLKDRTMKLAY